MSKTSFSWGYASEPMIKCAPQNLFLPSDCPAIPAIPALLGGLWSWKILSRKPKFGTPPSWCCCPRHPEFFNPFSCVMDSWHGTLNIILNIYSNVLFKCPIDSKNLFHRWAILTFNVCPGLPLWRRVVGPASNCQRGRVLAEVFWKGGLQGFNVIWIDIMS